MTEAMRALPTAAECCTDCQAGEHHWRQCPNCPKRPDQPCICAGVPCCTEELAEIIAEVESRNA